jgi:hypothetical protein
MHAREAGLGQGRKRASALVVHLAVAGVGPDADLSQGERCHRLLLVCMRGLVGGRAKAATSGWAGGAALATTSGEGRGSGGCTSAQIRSDLDLVGIRSGEVVVLGRSRWRRWPPKCPTVEVWLQAAVDRLGWQEVEVPSRNPRCGLVRTGGGRTRGCR